LRQSDQCRGGVERADVPSGSRDFRPYAGQRSAFATTGPDTWSASQQQGHAYGEPARVLTVLRRGGREVGRRERLYGIGGRPALPGPLPGGAGVQAAGAGRFPGLAPGHRQRQLPGQRRRAPPGFGGAGPGRQCANVVFERSAPLWSRRRDEGTSDGRRQAPVRQQALSGRLPGRRHARGERGRDRGEAPPGAAVPPRLGLVPAPGDLGRRRASGDRSPPRADGASRASCGASCRSQAICGSPLPAGSATRRARRFRICGCAAPGRFVHRNVDAEHRGGPQAPAPD
jgi:hypothetical protein